MFSLNIFLNFLIRDTGRQMFDCDLIIVHILCTGKPQKVIYELQS